MTTVYRDLALIAKNLAPGTSESGHPCPACGHAESFSIFATDEGRGWKCHRAKCEERRFYPWDRLNPAVVRSADAKRAAWEAFKPRPYPHPLVPLPSGHNLASKLGDAVTRPRGSAVYGVKARLGFLTEVVWTLRGFDHKPRGHVSKDYETRKVLTWRTVPGPVYGFFQFGPTDRLYIVEDCVSAARIAGAGGAGLALLGTHMTQDLFDELDAWLRVQATAGTSHRVIVALDPDANDKGYQLTCRLTTRTSHAIVWFPTSADPKDMGAKEFARLMDA